MATIRLVLLRPRNAENLGAVARAMANFGLTDWALVDPNPLLLESDKAKRLAVRSEELLKTVRIAAELSEAIDDCGWVVGTSMRKISGMTRIAPREVAIRSAELDGKLALVFGDERSGLTNAELQRCHDLSAIPTGAQQPSLNLAQAVLVYCYELHLAQLGEKPSRPAAPLATAGELGELERDLSEVLERGRFLRQPGRHAVRDMMRPLTRAQPTHKEVELWKTALRALGKRLDDR
jgi:tRNA/rRNA methyltransferase